MTYEPINPVDSALTISRHTSSYSTRELRESLETLKTHSLTFNDRGMPAPNFVAHAIERLRNSITSRETIARLTKP